MSEAEHAKILLDAAGKDLRAVYTLAGAADVDDEIFGFHAQQVIEKTLKAWVAYIGLDYPKTHDITLLLEILRRKGQDVERYWELVEYNPFAVQFRYESFGVADEPLDRPASLKRVEDLFEHVRQIVSGTIDPK